MFSQGGDFLEFVVTNTTRKYVENLSQDQEEWMTYSTRVGPMQLFHFGCLGGDRRQKQILQRKLKVHKMLGFKMQIMGFKID